jgi:iron(III) transport system permease protein
MTVVAEERRGPVGPLPRPAAELATLRSPQLFVPVTVALLLLLVLAPLAMLLYSSFRTGRPFLPGGAFTLDNYVTVVSSPANIEAIVNSFIFAGSSTAIALAVVASLAWLIERTDVPLREAAFTAVLLPLAIPGALYAIAWILLLSPEIGAVNVAARAALGVVGVHLQRGPFDVYGMPGLIFVDAVRSIPTMFLLVAGALRNLDPALEDAASTSGSAGRRTLARVTLPLIGPALLAAAIYNLIGSLESFEIPGLIGLPAGIYLYSTRIYWAANVKSPPDFGLANAFAVTFLVLSVLLIWQYQRATRHAERFATVTGKAYRPRRIALGRGRPLGLALVAAYVIVGAGLPVLMLAWTSLQPYVRVPSAEAIAQAGLANYASLAAFPGLLDAARNTLVLVFATATAVTALSFLVSWVVVRTRTRGRRILDGLAFTPHTIPGVVIGLAILLLYLGPLRVVPIYGTLAILVVALSTRYIAFSTRSANAAFIQVHRELEEASHVSGATVARTFRAVLLPLLLPGVLNVWIWVAVHAMRETSVTLMLYSGDNAVVATKLWFMWINGQVGQAAALGMLLVAAVALVSVAGRAVVHRAAVGSA